MSWFVEVWEQFYTAFLEKDRYLAFLKGFGTTLEVSFFAVILGVALGVILAIAKYMAANHKGCRPLGWIANIYITIIRGTPVYVQMLIIYYLILTARGIPAIISGVLCFGINSSAYVAEIIRAGIEAVDRGQMEAGRSLGLSEMRTMKSIIMPQAVRNILPALGNEFIVLIKETAVIGGITVLDVTKVAMNVGNSNYDYLTPLLIAALMYLVVVIILTKLLSMFERRLAKSDRR
ncbi:MAG: amino acid ABC transporter permease [Lachnospiraceae bacterium]|nr:amino acid ABC transporter permease [Lachnospiraceae bacterium]